MQCAFSVQRRSLTKEVWDGQGYEGPQWIKVHTSIGKWSCNQLKAVRPLGDLKFSPWWVCRWCSGIWHTRCLEIMQPFWISREPAAWPWSNSAARQRRPYCVSMNSHAPVGLVSRQWNVVDWACVLCDCHIHTDRESRSASSGQCACPFYSYRADLFFFCKTSHHPGLSAPLKPRFGSLWLLVFPKAKLAIESEEICEWEGHTVHKQSQRRLTADWLAPQESDCSRMYSKVSSDWLPSYIKATWLVLEIFKMAGYFPGRPHSIIWKAVTKTFWKKLLPPSPGLTGSYATLVPICKVHGITLHKYVIYTHISPTEHYYNWPCCGQQKRKSRV
jgi:hypothetical protein